MFGGEAGLGRAGLRGLTLHALEEVGHRHCRAKLRSQSRAMLMRLTACSYFWICWKATPTALASSSWLSPTNRRRWRSECRCAHRRDGPSDRGLSRGLSPRDSPESYRTSGCSAVTERTAGVHHAHRLTVFADGTSVEFLDRGLSSISTACPWNLRNGRSAGARRKASYFPLLYDNGQRDSVRNATSRAVRRSAHDKA